MTRLFSRNPIPLLVVFVLIAASSVALAAQPNYDPPEPSTDFGTPEATARIAAKAGFLDVVGVKLGIPLKAAVEAVKAHNANLKLEPQFKLEFEALPGVVMTPVMASTKNVSTASDPGRSISASISPMRRTRRLSMACGAMSGSVRQRAGRPSTPS